MTSAFPIITADQRLAEVRGVKAAIFGASGAGKTTLLRTLNSTTTLFFDLEAGDLAIEGLAIDTIRPRTWAECRDFAVFIGGPNPALRKEQSYSQDHFEAVCGKYGDPRALEKYDTVFINSITVAGRLCFQWCSGQAEAFSEKTGKADVRGAYGLHGREMIAWLTHLQHTRAKNVIFVGILDEKLDDFNRKVFVPQIDGSKTGLELPGIVDEVLTLTSLSDGEQDQETVRRTVSTANGVPQRVFVCQTQNRWGYPAKDRSGRLAMLEPPHLGQLIEKIRRPLPIDDRPLVIEAPRMPAPAKTPQSDTIR